jgi:hypothetical protein
MTVKVEAPEVQEPVEVGKMLQHSHPILPQIRKSKKKKYSILTPSCPNPQKTVP